jgi:succinyl-diaminopimelate desuccinylase
MSDTLDLAKKLIERKSVTPNDEQCQKIIGERLKKNGCKLESIDSGDVKNLWASHGETSSPLLAFAGHTDVVPPGQTANWDTDPFLPTVKNNQLYGRGAADMKTSVAAMTVAFEEFVNKHPHHNGTLGMMLTSDEEGDAINGTKKIIEKLNDRQTTIDWCLIGEPTSESKLGDTIKNGRRGSLSGYLVIRGLQGHVAYPERAKNPIHGFAKCLHEITTYEWDKGNEFFPPSSLQISNINAGTGVDNVIPGELKLSFNVRFSTETNQDKIKNEISAILNNEKIDYTLDWHLSGAPFITKQGALLDACKQAIKEKLNIEAQVSTSGGTSDGRFIAPTGAEVFEFGPINESIHKVNENIKVADIDKLKDVYLRVAELLLT